MTEPSSSPLPTFIIGGAPTSGTTSLHYYLARHPQVYMSPIKEPTYFAAADMWVREEFRHALERDRDARKAYMAGPVTDIARYWVTDWDDYKKLFGNVGGQIAIGESSASYLWLPSAAPAIRAKLPNVRLIFLLRDPADRLFSWYLMSQRRGPQVNFRNWLLKEMQQDLDGKSGLHRHLDGGLYATHLQRFYDIFPREQVRVFISEDFRSNPQEVLKNTCEFIGVDTDESIDVSRQFNETLVPRFPVLQKFRQRLPGKTSAIGWLPHSAQRALRKLYHRPRGHVSTSSEDRRLVIDYYRVEILRTQDLLGRDLRTWLR